MSDKATRVALGGVFSSLCLLLMMSTSIIPFSMFAAPMFAGAMLMIVVVENGYRTALMVYASVSILSIFLVPDIDAKLLFISFFGYYSIIKPKLECLTPKPKQIIVKFAIYNAAMLIGYFLFLKLFGLDEAATHSDFIGKYMPILMLIALNALYIMYDYLLTKYLMVYLAKLRPRLVRKK